MSSIEEVAKSEVWDEAAALRCLENPRCFWKSDAFYVICELPFDKARAAFLCEQWPEGLYYMSRQYDLNTPVQYAIICRNLPLFKFFVEFDPRVYMQHRNRRNILLCFASEHNSMDILRFILDTQEQTILSIRVISRYLAVLFGYSSEVVDLIIEWITPRLRLPAYQHNALWCAFFHGATVCQPHGDRCSKFAELIYRTQDECLHPNTFPFGLMCSSSFRRIFMLEHANGGARCHTAALQKLASVMLINKREVIDDILWMIETTGARYLQERGPGGQHILHALGRLGSEAEGISHAIMAADPSLLFSPDVTMRFPFELHGTKTGGVNPILMREMCARPRETMANIPDSYRFHYGGPDFDEFLNHARTPAEFLWIFHVLVRTISQWIAVARHYPPVLFERGTSRGLSYLYTAVECNSSKAVSLYAKHVQYLPATIRSRTGGVISRIGPAVYIALASVPRRASAWKRYVGPTSMLFVLHHAQFY